ncbi:YceI family protein [Sphingomonas profundi]|uniref:YceI family protein n=1 Tax=Alterirhizorhabdus profundi TaxID=2681549 RepID=UPI0012E956AE|nr:YceI family protein [Sphingomonas profundi]
MRLAPLAALALAAALPAAAQMPTKAPGTMDVKQVTAGTYSVDSGHTQVVFTVNHLGFNSYWGIFGGATGTLTIDPAKPNAATVSIEIPLNGLVTTSEKLNAHLATPDFFDAAKFPTATFKSTSVTVSGNSARIAGNLTLRGVTKPVVLDAKFTGAGNGPMPPHGLNVGFEATTSVKRSDFGISYGVPLVSDVVPLKITAAFEKK